MDQGSHPQRDSEHLMGALVASKESSPIQRSRKFELPKTKGVRIWGRPLWGRFLYDQDGFLERLRQERSRSDRSGRPFCMIVLELPCKCEPQDLPTTVCRAVARLPSLVRLCDVVGIYGERQLGILLPETEEKEAKLVLNRLKGHLERILGQPLGDCGENRGPVRLLEYPKTLKASLVERDSAAGPQGGQHSPQDSGHEAYQDRSVEWGFIRRSAPNWELTRNSFLKRLENAARRILDITGATLGLIVLSPLLLLIAFAIKITSPGPVLFKQKRVGQYGREFTFYKFRTMYHNCDQELHRQYITRLIENKAESYECKGGALYKLLHDPRVTPIGKFLRMTSLDELPQLLNVLKGEMSLVGPRPPIPYEVERYKTWQLRRILEAKPGITGLWQVCGRASTTFDEQVRLDLRYVEKQSLWLDLLIILRTFKAVLTTKGAC